MLKPVVLASASPARLRTLEAVGIHPVVHVSGIDEGAYADREIADLVRDLAAAKASAVTAELPEGLGDALVVGCDSMLELDGRVLGKPTSAAVASARWRDMRGRTAVLRTGHCLVDATTGRTAAATASTSVTFAEVSDPEIDEYVATGEPLHVAGAFTLDGYAGAFVTRVDGDPHNVIGLSLPLVRLMLPELGLTWLDVWRPAQPT